MAIYEYEILGPDGSVQGIYEAEQRMSDPPLVAHPETGAPLRRILSSTFAHSNSDATPGCGSSECAMPGGACGMGGCGGGGCDFN